MAIAAADGHASPADPPSKESSISVMASGYLVDDGMWREKMEREHMMGAFKGLLLREEAVTSVVSVLHW